MPCPLPLQTIRCPLVAASPESAKLPGCGSYNVTAPDDEGLYDCLDCGLWFPADA